MTMYYSKDANFLHLSPMYGVSKEDAVRSIKKDLLDLVEDFGLPRSEKFFDDFMKQVESSLEEYKTCENCKDDYSLDEFYFDPDHKICDSCYERKIS